MARPEHEHQDRPSFLARLFGRASEGLAHEASYAVADIRNTHERAWFDREVTPGYQAGRFEALYGTPESRGPETARSHSIETADHERDGYQAARFEDLYGTPSTDPSDAQMRDDDRTMER